MTGKNTTAGWRTDGVGIYRFDFASKTWLSITSGFFDGGASPHRPKLTWLRSFAVDPMNPQIVYVAATDWIDWSANGNNGLWRTENGGVTWSRVSTLSGCWGVSFHLAKPNWVYLTCSEGEYSQPGLWLSKDNGKTFPTAAAGMAFPFCTRVTADPQDPDTIYVGTFGGSVFRGPADLNSAPSLGALPNLSIPQGTGSGPIAVTVGDVETAAASLVVTVTSGNPSLIPAAGLVLGGSGANRTLTITPASSQSGSAVVTVRVRDDGGRTTQVSFTLTVVASADSWIGQDLGPVESPGSHSLAGSKITVHASGMGVRGTSDSAYVVSQTLNGDGVMTAKLVSFTGAASNFAQAGLMIRESLDQGSREAACLETQGMGVRLSRRRVTNGVAGRILGSQALAPRWLKLERTGDIITGWERSTSNAAWDLVGQVSLPGLSTQVYIGLVVDSLSTTQTATAVFDQIQIIQSNLGGG